MDQKHGEFKEAYDASYKRVEDFQGTHDLLAGAKVEANKEKIIKHAETVRRIKELLDSMKAREAKTVVDAKNFANQNNPGNTTMFLEAYNDYFDYLATQETTTDEQIDAMVKRIDSLETLLKSEQLETNAEQHPIPAEIIQQVPPENMGLLKGAFVEIVTQRIADLHGMTPKNEEMDAMWQEALGSIQKDEHVEVVDEEFSDKASQTKTSSRLRGPVALVRANPGFAGWYRTRDNRTSIRAGRN